MGASKGNEQTGMVGPLMAQMAQMAQTPMGVPTGLAMHGAGAMPGAAAMPGVPLILQQQRAMGNNPQNSFTAQPVVNDAVNLKLINASDEKII